MVLNLRSLSFGSPDGRVGEEEALMVANEMRWPGVTEWNVLEGLQDGNGRVQTLGRNGTRILRV